MSDCKFSTLQLKKPRLWENHSSICYSSSLTPPTNYTLKALLFCLICHTPIETGAFDSTRDLFLRVDNEKTCKKPAYGCLMASIGRNTCPMVGFNGFYQSPGPPLSGNACGIIPVHHRSHHNGQQSWSIFPLLFCLLLAWQPLGQYRASSCPMAASSGFRSSPGHAKLGNAICIAPLHRHGHQNGQQRSNILMPSSILSSTITVAKDHVMVH